jgi:hypothetical protein
MRACSGIPIRSRPCPACGTKNLSPVLQHWVSVNKTPESRRDGTVFTHSLKGGAKIFALAALGVVESESESTEIVS